MRATDLLDRGELVRLLYRLGIGRSTGVLELESAPNGDEREQVVLRDGYLMVCEAGLSIREASRRLARLSSFRRLRYRFNGSPAAFPPGMAVRLFPVARWARTHLEQQVDAAYAHVLVRELAGARLVLRRELAPNESLCDETDRRILAAMAQPRRLDQIWPLARTPRYRLLTFVHFLRHVGALELRGVAAALAPTDSRRGAASRLLGIDSGAPPGDVKRAYRRLARALHPDLHPSASLARKRLLELKFAEISAAYRDLVGPQ